MRPRSFTLILLVAIVLAAPAEAKAEKDHDKADRDKLGRDKPGEVPKADPVPRGPPHGGPSADPTEDAPLRPTPAPSPPPAPTPPAPRAKARAPVLDDPAASSRAPAEVDAETRAAPIPPTPPARRLGSLEAGAFVAQGRVTLALPAPAPFGAEGTTRVDAPRVSPWAWALPLLGMVGLGAALATTRPRDDVSPARARPRMRFAEPAPTSLLLAGKAAVEAGALDEALAWFTQVVKLDPRLAVAHFCRGVCLTTLERHAEAYRAFAEAYELDPGEAAFRLELARAAARTSRHQEAMRLLAPVLEALPELAKDVAADEAFASLGDHPRWLALTGRL